MSAQDQTRHRALLLWTAFLVPAVAWFVQLNANFLLAAYACASDRMWILHVISLAATGLAAGGIWVAYRCWRSQSGESEPSGRASGPLSLGTLILATLLLVAILANEVSNWMLEPCQ